VAGLAALVGVLGCGDADRIAVDDADLQGYEAKVTNIIRNVSREGGRILRLRADSAYVAPAGPTRFMGVEATTFLPDGASATVLEADSAVIPRDESTFTAWAGHLVNREETLEVEAAEFHYDLTAGRMEARGEVVVEERGRTSRVACASSTLLLQGWSDCS
jgi:hypothetical protein